MVIKKGMADQKVTEGDTAKLEVEATKPNVPGQWFKDDSPIEKSDRVDMSVADTTHSLTIKDTKPEDQGEYTIEVGDDASTARLTVEGRLLWQRNALPHLHIYVEHICATPSFVLFFSISQLASQRRNSMKITPHITNNY